MSQEKHPIRIAIGENLWMGAWVAGSEVQRHTIEKLMDYLWADGFPRRRFTVEELFPLAG
jgi:hypothetical protein